MKFRDLPRCLIVLCLAASMLHLPTTRGAENLKQTGEMTALGLVKIDGELARSGQTLFSGSTIETAQDATSFINLGGRGRLELLSNSSINLGFDASTLQGLLNMGRARVSVPMGIKAQISTKVGTVINDSSQPTIFSVGFWNDDLIVSVMMGRVELHEQEGHIRQVSSGLFVFVADSAQIQSNSKKETSRRKLAAILLPIGAALVIVGFIFAREKTTRSRSRAVSSLPAERQISHVNEVLGRSENEEVEN